MRSLNPGWKNFDQRVVMGGGGGVNDKLEFQHGKKNCIPSFFLSLPPSFFPSFLLPFLLPSFLFLLSVFLFFLKTCDFLLVTFMKLGGGGLNDKSEFQHGKKNKRISSLLCFLSFLLSFPPSFFFPSSLLPFPSFFLFFLKLCDFPSGHFYLGGEGKHQVFPSFLLSFPHYFFLSFLLSSCLPSFPVYFIIVTLS